MKSDEWCNGKDIVYDSKTHRCSVCGRRLSGSGSRATYIDGNGVEIKSPFFVLPPHKEKGYKIKRKKGHNQKVHNKMPYRNVSNAI